MRSLTWPQNQFYLAPGTDATEPLLLFSGIEPHLRWQRFSDQFIDFLLECGVEHLISFGALLNAVPHTRKPFVNGSSGTPEIKATMQRLGISRGGSYNGPTGISSVIAEAGQRPRNLLFQLLGACAALHPDITQSHDHSRHPGYAATVHGHRRGFARA